MKKTPKMLEVEERIGEPIGDYLRREYVDEKMSAVMIAEKFGISYQTVYRWLKENKIEIRDNSEANLPKEFVKPSKRELERMYINERMSAVRIAERFGVGSTTVYRWLKEDEVGIRTLAQSQLPGGIIKPAKEDLESMYIDKKMSLKNVGKEFGVSNSSVLRWLRNYGIKTREKRQLPWGFVKPSKENLERMYIDENRSIRDIGKEFDVRERTIYVWLRDYGIKRRKQKKLPDGFTKPTKEELERMYVEEGLSTYKIGKILGISQMSAFRLLKKYNIPVKKINKVSDTQFKDFLRNNKTALNLAGAAVLMNGAGNDIESLIIQTYQGTLKDRKELHSLLEKNRQEIYSLINEGLTNLGMYIGDFSLDERAIIPVLIGQAISSIPDEKLTSSLEKRVINILRTQYSPLFNENMQGTLKTIEGRVAESEGKVRGIYQRLYNHYSETMKLMEELA